MVVIQVILIDPFEYWDWPVSSMKPSAEQKIATKKHHLKKGVMEPRKKKVNVNGKIRSLL